MAPEPQVGQPAPDFALPSTHGQVTLSLLAAGKKVVLAFYAEDNTPACTSELAAARLYGVVDDTGKRSRRAVFVVDRGGALTHKVPWYNPANAGQYEEILRALGYGHTDAAP
ncbi:MAG: redoxin domain-containing protein [Dehalococcoidia bacterium]